MSNTSKIALFSFISGSLIGAFIALLYAPDKGSLSRKKLKAKVQDLSDDLSEKYDSIMHDLKDIKDYIIK